MLKLINYLFILIWFIIFYFISNLEYKISDKNKHKIVLISTILLSLFAGVRSIGTDLENYRFIFSNFPLISNWAEYLPKIFEFRYEPAFTLITSFFIHRGFSFEFFLFFYALIPMFIIDWIIFKNEKKRPLTVFFIFLLFYLLIGPLDIIRQFFSASIFLLALHYLAKNKKNTYYSLAVVASFFHYSSLISVFAKKILQKKWNIVRYILFLIFALILGMILNSTLTSIMDLNSDMNFELSAISKFFNYLQSNIVFRSTSRFFHYKLLINIPAIINILTNILFLSYGYNVNINKFEKTVLNSSVLGTILYVFFIGLDVNLIAYRIYFTMGIGNMFILNKLLDVLEQKKKTIFFNLLVLVLLFYNFIIITYSTEIFL